MESVAQPNRNVSIDITKHIKTFIDPNNGNEISREQVRAMSRGVYQSSSPKVFEQTESNQDGGGEKIEGEGK